LRVIEVLENQGVEISCYDPYVSEYVEHGVAKKGESELSVDILEDADLVIITTAHTTVDYEFVQKHSKMIFGTKNVMKNISCRKNIEVL